MVRTVDVCFSFSLATLHTFNVPKLYQVRGVEFRDYPSIKITRSLGPKAFKYESFEGKG